MKAVLALCVLVAPVWGQSKAFTFTASDERLLEEVDMLDRLFEKEGLVFRDAELDAFLESLAQPLIASAGTPERVHWRFRTLRDPSVSALALPNGSIYVHTGLLALLQNEAQLTGVLAHELFHVSSRHTYLHYRSYRKKMTVKNVVSAAAHGGTMLPVGQIAGIVFSILDKVCKHLPSAVVTGYSSDQEHQADSFALERLAAAGFDPTEFSKTIRLLDEWLDAEPARTFYRDADRLAERLAYITPLLSRWTRMPATPSLGKPYLDFTEKAIRYNVQADIDSRRFRSAVARAKRLVDCRPGEPENLVLLAEAYRELGPRAPVPTGREASQRGQLDARKRLAQKTVEEEEKELLSHPEGRQLRVANLEIAEEFYKRSQAADAAFPPPYRGLGMLYQELERTVEARDAYRKFLELAPGDGDALRIKRRLDVIDKALIQRSN